MKRLAALFTVCALLIAGCGGDESTTTTEKNRGTHIGSALSCTGGPDQTTECKESK